MPPSIRSQYHRFCFFIAYRLHCAFGNAAAHHYTKRDKAVLDELSPRRATKEIK